jgi:hypothetical protein
MSQSSNKTVAWGLRIVLLASLTLFLLATLTETNKAPISAAPTPPLTNNFTRDTLIIPGTRVGPVTLGLPIKILNEVLGAAQMRPQGQGLVHLYPEPGLVVYSENDRVVSVTVRSPTFKTRSGVGVGSDVDEVLRTLSGDYEMEGAGREYRLHNWSEGWHLEVQDNKVTYIQITAKLTESEEG